MPYPYERTVGEQYAHNNDPDHSLHTPPCSQTEVPVEGRARTKVGLVFDDSTAGPRGRRLRVVSKSSVSQYGEQSAAGTLQPFVGEGGFMFFGAPGPRGRVVRPYVRIGCRSKDQESPGIIESEFPQSIGVVSDAKRFQEFSRLRPYFDDSSTGPRGRVLRFKGVGGCPNELQHGQDPYDPWEPDPVWSYGEPVDVQRLYHFDVFGQRCVSCPILFATFARPCIDCSYPPGFRDWLNHLVPPRGNVCHYEHQDQVTDFCAEEGASAIDLGEAHCIPGVRTGCELLEGGIPTEHHCEECVFERNLGHLIGIVLQQSDCLSKVPMRPVRYEEAHHGCSYGCGEFGWTLWSAFPSLGLRIPYQGWPISGVDDFWNDAYVTSQERSCSTSGCFNGFEHESNFGWCGTGVTCRCGDGPGEHHCTTTHQFRWNRFGKNFIKEAYLCFKQWEACNRTGTPCPSDINQGVSSYHNPPAQLMVWVTARVVIELEFMHWGPLGNDSDRRSSCGCCYFQDISPDSIIVRLVGEFCGPVPWGDVADVGWAGFVSDELERQGLYPGTFEDPVGTDVADHRGNCGAMFVDQGTYGDGLDAQLIDGDGNPLFDPNAEPPKRCPSRLAGPKFYCPPSLFWNWTYTEPTNRWKTGEWLQPNQRQAKPQCWSLQLARNDGDGCAGGRINSGGSETPAIGCHDPNCRRGCSTSETLDADGVRVSPWQLERATPWGCGHCVDQYPSDPLAIVGI